MKISELLSSTPEQLKAAYLSYKARRSFYRRHRLSDKHPLLIIDMQETFPAYIDCAQDVLSAVKTCIAEQRPIITLEYVGCGKTIAPIRTLLKDYPYHLNQIKYDNDGSSEALAAFETMGLDYRKVYVCGINTCFCVRATVEGLREKVPNISTVVFATACDCCK